MKTIGLIGGMSWQSTVEYYRIINNYIQEQVGDLHSAKILLSSIDFHELEKLQRIHEWRGAEELIYREAVRLEAAGADVLLICSNTGNECACRLAQRVTVPVLHIADAVGREARRLGLKTVGLLGTIYTMEKGYIRGILEQEYDLDVVVPNQTDRKKVSRIIYQELCYGVIKRESKDFYQKVVNKLANRGAEGVILGCTEIPLLIKPEDVDLPILDTTLLHSLAAAQFIMEKVPTLPQSKPASLSMR